MSRPRHRSRRTLFRFPPADTSYFGPGRFSFLAGTAGGACRMGPTAQFSQVVAARPCLVVQCADGQ